MTEPIALDASKRFDVSDRAVFITGGAHGLGLATASAFVGAGARVAIADIDADGLEAARQRLGDSVYAFELDVRDEGAVSAVVEEAATALGWIDVVINDAAVYPVSTFADLSGDDLAGILDVNVVGYARIVRAALPYLTESRSARVVNMASITFFLGIPPGLSAYITSKGAVIGLTHALARELGPQGIGVNAIAPGAFPTRAEEIIEDRAAYDRQILESQCIKRRGDVADIAAAALFLSSSAASFITGQTLLVDGGWVFS